MNFNKHSDLEGKHAFMGASNYHWINYTDEKFIRTFQNYTAKERGTILHQFAHDAIKLGVCLPDDDHTLNRYVNDAIFYGLEPEVVLYFSEFSFGTADAIQFDGQTLRIHDLKTGSTKASVHQLEVYAALFCLEYDVNPTEIDIILRIYQSDEIFEFVGDPDYILFIMEKIIHGDRVVRSIPKRLEIQ